MIPARGMTKGDVDAAVELAARDLVAVRKIAESNFLNLPLLYPDGSCVTLKIDKVASGIRVSDNGFAYREAESIGGERSYGRIAGRIADAEGVQSSSRVIFLDTDAEQLFRAICDVAIASWKVADDISQRVADREETEIAGQLTERLERVFGQGNISPAHSIVGSSTEKWDVSAIVQADDHRAVFQAVSRHANSIYRTSTAFRDISELENPPRLVAVVQSKPELGPRLALLSPGRVIEAGQSDDVFKKAAA